MNWKDRIKNIPLEIKTGDGKTYFPLFKSTDSEKEKEFNTSSFEFISVYGTLVDRKKPKSGKFPLIFYFEGEDNIHQSDVFEESSDDPRPWTVVHPFYGTISGQPLSIKRKDNFLNSTEITVDFWESIPVDYPARNYAIKDNTRDLHDSVYLAALNSYISGTKFTSADIAKNKVNILTIAGNAKKLNDDSAYAQFQNALNKGLKAIDDLLDGPLEAIESIQKFLDLPARYEKAIAGRIASYEGTYERLKYSIDTLVDKKYFESIGASTIASMCDAMVNPLSNDYILVADIEKMYTKLEAIHDDYKKVLDSNKIDIYDIKKSYSPDVTTQQELGKLVTFTKANLFKLTFNAKRERIVYTNKKTNALLLVHRYVGLDASDENLERFLKLNNIVLNELFTIQKDRKIVYIK
jgi:translation elongation factor P/translation initiation factor 5A